MRRVIRRRSRATSQKPLCYSIHRQARPRLTEKEWGQPPTPGGAKSRLRPARPRQSRAGFQAFICRLRGTGIAPGIAPERRSGDPVVGRGQRHERSCRCADHRRRRVRRGGGLEPGRNEDAHPLPRTRRLDEPGDLPEHRPRLGGALFRRLFPEPEYPRPARGLPDQRRQLADQGRELQRRRRRHGDVHGAFAAPAPVRLPRAARSTASPTTGRSITTRWSRSSSRTTG